MARRLLLVGGRVARPDGFVDGLAVALHADRIVAVAPESECPPGDRVEVGGLLIAPGLVDTHLHGGLEADTMDARPEALIAISRHLATHGVTGWTPTTVACDPDQLDRVLTAIRQVMAEGTGGAEVLGAHLESSFIARAYKGAQPEAHLRAPDDAAMRAVIEKHRDVVRIVTLAPELPGAIALIRTLVSWGIAVAVGHSDATYDQVLEAVAAGASRVTHLCNAQRPFHHREPGVVGAGLVTDALATEIIADLVHVHPAGLEIAYRCKGAERLMLVSDALRGTGLAPGEYELGGQKTTLDGQVARLPDGTIAGSTITLERAVANVIDAARVPAHAAIAMASAVPLSTIGLVDRGRVAPGMRADLAFFAPDFTCRAAMVAGAWVHGGFAAGVSS